MSPAHSPERRQTGANEIQALGHQLAEIAGTAVTAPMFYRHNESRRQRRAGHVGHQFDVGHPGMPGPDEFGQDGGE